MSGNAIVYGLLLGCFGAGAVGGALVMQAARARWPTEAIVTTAVVVLGVTIVAIGRMHHLPGLMLVMVVSGGAWIVFIALANAVVQSLAPDWVRARLLAIFLLITQGGLAGGSVLWGAVASRTSVDTALLWAGLSTIATAALALVAKFPNTTADVSPWNHWRMPIIVRGSAPDADKGPVLVTLEYRVEPQDATAFLRAIEAYGRIRRRDGAFRWGIYQDLEQADVYLEVFLVDSWAEHVRQHERLTRGDSELERRVRSHVRHEPVVRHLVYADSQQ
jgi:hypothetical protein